MAVTEGRWALDKILEDSVGVDVDQLGVGRVSVECVHQSPELGVEYLVGVVDSLHARPSIGAVLGQGVRAAPDLPDPDQRKLTCPEVVQILHQQTYSLL